MQIIDENGRIGDVTEIREKVIFAKPVGIDYLLRDIAMVTGVPEATLITETSWFLIEADGSYLGLWFDSPVGSKFLTATIYNGAAAALGRKGGLARSERKTESCRANARKPRKKKEK